MQTSNLIEEIIAELQDPENLKVLEHMDEGDVGNLVGIAIAKHLQKDGIQTFLHGMEHGVSLTNGSHDSIDIEHLSFFMECDTPEMRHKAMEQLKKLSLGAKWK